MNESQVWCIAFMAATIKEWELFKGDETRYPRWQVVWRTPTRREI